MTPAEAPAAETPPAGEKLRIAFVAAGAAGMYCGTCLHDNLLATTLMEQGHEVALIPTYTPLRTDEESVAQDQIFFGALNVFLQQKAGLFRKTPLWFDRLFDNKKLLSWIARLGGSSTDARMLGEITLSMVQGDEGKQGKELEKLVEFLRDIVKPEIVHLSSSLFSGFARRIQEELRVPVVCSFSGEDLFLSEIVEPYRSRVLATLSRRAAEVDGFASPCNYCTDTMTELYGLPREKVFAARLGIHAHQFRNTLERQSSGGPLTLGYLARNCPEKGLGVFVETVRLLGERYPADKLRFRVAGYLSPKDQAFYAEQQRKVAEWGLAGRMDWVGEVDLEGKVAFLESLDVLSVPTLYREPKGVFVAEALASGVPVVQPRHGSFPEWVENTGGGLLAEPENPESFADEIAKLLDDPDLRRQLGTNGRESVHGKYTAEAMT
ncbi:MAG: glycosyltransferase family 4 protein, partial [Holophagales bacterium]|nr:glycosyltransferase family 4 protein [Holophagales bacterium]